MSDETAAFLTLFFCSFPTVVKMLSERGAGAGSSVQLKNHEI